MTPLDKSTAKQKKKKKDTSIDFYFSRLILVPKTVFPAQIFAPPLPINEPKWSNITFLVEGIKINILKLYF